MDSGWRVLEVMGHTADVTHDVFKNNFEYEYRVSGIFNYISHKQHTIHQLTELLTDVSWQLI